MFPRVPNIASTTKLPGGNDLKYGKPLESETTLQEARRASKAREGATIIKWNATTEQNAQAPFPRRFTLQGNTDLIKVDDSSITGP